jgi:hypothetical protein
MARLGKITKSLIASFIKNIDVETMVLKVLTLNFSAKDVPVQTIPANIEITQATFTNSPTPHDFHVLLIDASEVLNSEWWEKSPKGYITSSKHTHEYFLKFKDRIGEQIRTGGITFCISYRHFGKYFSSEFHEIDNYFFCPIDLGIVNEKGNTFHLKYEELKYFNPLFCKIPVDDIEWDCYFSKPPEEARILGTNRARYPVFMEVPLGAGKLVLLPRFKDRQKAVAIIIKEIIPQMIQAEDFVAVPQWVFDFSSPYEQNVKTTLKELETAKRLLYTKDKALKKAVAFGFKKLGFKVDVLPDGTLPDLRISDGEQKIVVEVKGHENKQADRKDVLQLLGYISEEDTKEKGVFVSNHEFNNEPEKRRATAFTDGAILLADCNNISLISSVDLYGSVLKILGNKLSDATAKEIRKKIMTGHALVSL